MRRTEPADSEEHDLHTLFTKVVAVLAGGDLTFTPPFDLATASALAANIDHGRIAQALFDVTAQRDTSYRVEIHALAPGVGEREVVNTTVPSTAMLIELLDSLLDEYLAHQEHEGDPSGG